VRFRYSLMVALAVGATHLIASSDLSAVHEWGTFTSAAGEDGAAMGWQTLAGPSDLPCFVHHLDQRNLKLADYGTVRMETPVLYFYPLKPLTVSVRVDFPHGLVTEWFPQASSVQPSSGGVGWIEWRDVSLGSGTVRLPKLVGTSRYYAARETDAWSLRSERESEKLLFYRGLGYFDVDLKAVVHDSAVSMRNDGAETIPEAILFENHAGKVGYHVIRNFREPANVDFSALTGTLDNLRAELEEELTEMGLYRKEAHAMVETWRDSWFEEGLRVFYILPRAKVDALLPISIHPAPDQLARVFVGRVELLSPHTKQEIAAALVNGDIAVLQKYGRFLNAFLREMSDGRGDLPMSESARQFLDRLYAQALAESHQLACSQ
jgi:hypothetical protein